VLEKLRNYSGSLIEQNRSKNERNTRVFGRTLPNAMSLAARTAGEPLREGSWMSGLRASGDASIARGKFPEEHEDVSEICGIG
jgi:hypothetical protein